MARKKKKQETVQNIVITGIADKGRGIGRDEEGRVLFVERVAPGDIVDVLVYKKKKNHLEAYPVKYLKYSEERVRPFCEHFGVCGGCKYQHITYEAQLKYKQNVVENAIRRIGKIEVEELQPILPVESNTYYRNKLEFTFSNKRWLTSGELKAGVSNLEDVLGFHRPGGFDKIVDIKHCYLQPDPSNDIRNFLRDLAIEMGFEFYDAREHEGFARNIVIRTTTLGETMLIVVFKEAKMELIKPYLDEVIRVFPMLTSLYYCINPKMNDFILDLEMDHYHGSLSIEEMLRDVRFKIGPKSFFQTNPKQATRLFELVEEFAGLTGEENVYDLYTGLGSIALFIAHKCKQVVGIEEVEAAIDDARKNMELNNIDNAVFYVGDVKDVLDPGFAKKHDKPDVVITDPPRAGMHAKVVNTLLELDAPKIVYVSCNPATQARDLNLLKEKYKVAKMRPVDMFPHTHHIENVALLVRRS